MRVVLVAFEITKDIDRESVHAAIRKSGKRWWHYLDSVWMVQTNRSAHEIGTELAPLLKGDNLLAIEVVGFAQGSLPSKAWDWINEHVPRQDGDLLPLEDPSRLTDDEATTEDGR